MERRRDHIEEIFSQAVAIESESDRRQFLSQACGDDRELLREIEGLLTVFISARSFHDRPVTRSTTELSEHVRASARSPADSAAAVLSQLRPVADQHALGSIDHYVVSCVLGQGAMGVVLKAWDTKLARHVALKFLNPYLAVDSFHRERFLREARAMAAIKHQNVASVFSIEDRKTGPYIVMECVAGESLAARLNRNEAFELPEIISIARQISAGLVAAHQKGIIHRDIKPSNILTELKTGRVVILDFGLVISRSSEQNNGVAGTPAYMAPEQWFGHPVDGRSDLFSLGAVLYTLCVGKRSFILAYPHPMLRHGDGNRPASVRVHRPDLPHELAQLIDRLLEIEPDKRPPSADAVRQSLDRLPLAMPVQERALRCLRGIKKMVALRQVPIVLGVALLGSFAMSGWQWSRPSVRVAHAERRRITFDLYRNHQSFLVSADNAVCADEFNSRRYWRPAVPGKWGEVVYCVRFDRAIETCRLCAKVWAWQQFDAMARAQLYVSSDQDHWYQCYDTGTHGNGTQCNLDAYEVTSLDKGIRGKREFYVKARLYSRDAETADLRIAGVVRDRNGRSLRIGPAYAQFLRSARGAADEQMPFSVVATFQQDHSSSSAEKVAITAQQ